LKEEQEKIAKTSQKNIEKQTLTPSNPNLQTQNEEGKDENNVDTN